MLRIVGNVAWWWKDELCLLLLLCVWLGVVCSVMSFSDMLVSCGCGGKYESVCSQSPE